MTDGHFIERCNICRTVTGSSFRWPFAKQCRCMACDKTERWTVCESCRIKPPASVAPLAVPEPLPPHEPDHGRVGNPVNWCRRCELDALANHDAGPTPFPIADKAALNAVWTMLREKHDITELPLADILVTYRDALGAAPADTEGR